MERQQLRQLVLRHCTPQQIALRAEIILLADEGHNHREIARSLNISRDMASLWRSRWLAKSEKDISVVERLQDAERPGGPATFSLEQILQLFAIACKNPQTYGRPISDWTPRTAPVRVLVESPPEEEPLTTKSTTSAKRTSMLQNVLKLEKEPSVLMK